MLATICLLRACSRAAAFREPARGPVSEGLAAKINSVCVDALDKGIQDGMAAKGDEIVRDLMGESMASKRPVWIHAVAFHPENRFGAGLEPVDAWYLLKNHAPMWVVLECG